MSNRRFAGKVAQATGEVWEEEFDARMNAAGILSLQQHPKVKHLGKELGLRVVGSAYVDRVLLCGPRSAITELKSTTNKGRYRIEKGRGASSTQKQFYHMLDAVKNGTPAFYTVLWRAQEQIEVFPVLLEMTWPVTVVHGAGRASWDRFDGLWPYKLRKLLFEDNGLAP